MSSFKRFSTVRFCLVCLLFLFTGGAFISCKKEAAKSQLPLVPSFASTSKILTDSACTSSWQGYYLLYGQPELLVRDTVFRKNGYIQLVPRNAPYDDYYTSFKLTIPDCEVINGDDFKFEASLENPDSFRFAKPGYDVNMIIYGSVDTARVLFEGAEVYQQYDLLKVGSYGITNVKRLVHLFEGFTKISLVAKNNHLSVLINDRRIAIISYAGTSIGEVKKIQFVFKNSGKIDWVKLENISAGQRYLADQFITPYIKFYTF